MFLRIVRLRTNSHCMDMMETCLSGHANLR